MNTKTTIQCHCGSEMKAKEWDQLDTMSFVYDYICMNQMCTNNIIVIFEGTVDFSNLEDKQETE